MLGPLGSALCDVIEVGGTEQFEPFRWIGKLVASLEVRAFEASFAGHCAQKNQKQKAN